MARTQPPGPRGQRLIGDVRCCEADRMSWLRRTREEYGDVVRLVPDTAVAHDRDIAHGVLASTNTAFLLDTSLLAGRRHRRRAHAGLAAWQAARRDVWRGFADRIARDHLRRLVDVTRAEFAAGEGPGRLLRWWGRHGPHARVRAPADVVITMGCGDACPIFPGKRYLDWQLEDPAGKGVEDVRPIRDEIDRRVRELLTELLAAGA